MISGARRLAELAAFAMLAAGTIFATPACAQGEPETWSFSSDRGYGYGGDGKMLSYKMGTNNAKFLLKGAKKVPRNTLFFIGENGQLYMRSGPYLEGGGKFMFGPG